MHYRKRPAQAPRLLLRIAAVTGTGVMFGVAACSPAGAEGLSPNPQPDVSDAESAADTGPAGFVTGIMPCTPPMEVCGVIALPRDAGKPDGSADAGDAEPADAAGEAGESRDGAVADAAGDAAVGCPGVCGLVVPPHDE
jgi:hypothetical protein